MNVRPPNVRDHVLVGARRKAAPLPNFNAGASYLRQQGKRSLRRQWHQGKSWPAVQLVGQSYQALRRLYGY
jgi:hypothetical protein